MECASGCCEELGVLPLVPALSRRQSWVDRTSLYRDCVDLGPSASVSYADAGFGKRWGFPLGDEKQRMQPTRIARRATFYLPLVCCRSAFWMKPLRMPR